MQEKIRLKEIEMEEMIIQEKRRAEEIQLQKEEMQMQLNMKELELEQFRLSKEKEETMSLVLLQYKLNLILQKHQICSTFFS